MTKPIGAIGSNDDKLAALQKKKLFEKTNNEGAGAFVAHLQINPADFSKSGTVPGWNSGNVPMTENT